MIISKLEIIEDCINESKKNIIYYENTINFLQAILKKAKGDEFYYYFSKRYPNIDSSNIDNVLEKANSEIKELTTMKKIEKINLIELKRNRLMTMRSNEKC